MSNQNEKKPASPVKLRDLTIEEVSADDLDKVVGGTAAAMSAPVLLGSEGGGGGEA